MRLAEEVSGVPLVVRLKKKKLRFSMFGLLMGEVWVKMLTKLFMVMLASTRRESAVLAKSRLAW